MPSPKLLEAILRALAGAGRGTRLPGALRQAPRLARMLPGRGGRALPGLGSAADVAPDIARVARGPVRTAVDVAPPGLPELRMAGEGLPPYPGRTPGRRLVEELSDRELAELAGEAWRRGEAATAHQRPWQGDMGYQGRQSAAAAEEAALKRLPEIQSEWMRRRGTGAGLEASLMGEGPPPRRLPSVSEFDQLDAAVLEGMDVSMAPGRGRKPYIVPDVEAAKAEGLTAADLDRISEHARKYKPAAKGAEKAIREAELPPMQKRLLARAGKPSEKFQITIAGTEEPMALYGIILNDGTSIRSTKGVKAGVPHTDLVTAPRKGTTLADIPTQRRMDAVGDFLKEGGVRTRTNARPKGQGRLLYVQFWDMTDEQVKALSQHLSDFDEMMLDGPHSIGVNLTDPTPAKLRAALRQIQSKFKRTFGELPKLGG